ncbi:MAG: Gfo/Idh/MocA family oxidoreductase [Armatimonadetes bacterium]|nr:Gfo/Idh/MocA family oxidoreductase [Armatimonadota bacterium]
MSAADARVVWGFVGAGGVARRRMLPAVAGLPQVRVGAVMVREMARAEAIAAEFGADAAYDDVHAMLADPRLEAVYIATPPASHRALVEAAAAAGRHILLEKPMALTVADCEAMEQAAERAGVLLSVCFPMRHSAAMVRLRDWLLAGDLGDCTYLRAQMAKWYPLDAVLWRADPAQAGGGVVMDLGSHLLDLAVWLVGPLASVEAQVASRAWAVPVEDSALLALRFESGALGVLEMSFATAGNHTAVEVYGTHGTARQVDGGLWRSTPAGVEEVVLAEDDVYRLELLDFQQALRGGPPPRTSAADGRVNTHWLRQAYLSAARRGT